MQKHDINNFDTFILDLDSTVWSGIEPTFWAKKLEFPIRRSGKRIYDKNKNYIELTNGIKEFLSYLNFKHKKISFLTRGALPDVEYNKQPAIVCLKKFGIYTLFNYENYAIHKTELKSNFLKVYKKTMFIDDNPIDLKDISEKYPEVTTIDKNSFTDWRELI